MGGFPWAETVKCRLEVLSGRLKQTLLHGNLAQLKLGSVHANDQQIMKTRKDRSTYSP